MRSLLLLSLAGVFALAGCGEGSPPQVATSQPDRAGSAKPTPAICAAAWNGSANAENRTTLSSLGYTEGEVEIGASEAVAATSAQAEGPTYSCAYLFRRPLRTFVSFEAPYDHGFIAWTKQQVLHGPWGAEQEKTFVGGWSVRDGGTIVRGAS